MTPDALTDEDIDRGRLLFAGPCAFMLGVVGMAGLPEEGPPEIAFAGRSNVGKSSLLNALTGRKNLARASNTPGRTKEINYFDLGGALRLVDLPGYGYARATRKDAKKWAGLTRDFLRGRRALRRVCLLIDARHGLKDVDEEVMSLLDAAAVTYQLVLTKADKEKPTEIAALIARTAEQAHRRPAAHPVIFATSAETGYGLPALRGELARLAGR
ncbi:MAG: ribosome biogenesis GTP-binding protein YihA/YsxC [Parvularculaceae bacterium]